jgi:glucose-1-phosphate adenylyltransferase
MGIYIFSRECLNKYLCADAEDPNSSNDFGKNIIPAMLAAGERMYAYPFEGYWKDVGTISSLWEANMDLLGKTPVLSLNDEAWRIYSRHEAHAPQYVGENAVVENCSLTEGCEIYGIVRNSVLGAGVRVMEGAEVCDSVIMGNVTIKAGAKVNYSIVDADVVVGEGCVIGSKRAEANDIAVIATKLEIPAGVVVKAGAMISSVEDIEKEVK